MTSTQIRDIFDRIAPVYDQLNDWLSLGQHRIWKQMVVKWSGAKPGDTCIDLCCGSGDLALRLARQVGSKGYVYGVDFSPRQLEIAKKRSTEQQYLTGSAISWVEADVLKLPFEDNKFAAATMGYGLRNVINIPCSLGELYRVLKPGAKAAILDFHRPSNLQLKAFQQWYLDTVVVPIAKNLGLSEEYAYISPSLDRFPTGVEQVELANHAGFAAKHYPISGGMMGSISIDENLTFWLASLDWSNLWLYIGPPVVGGVIGYFTNDLAIKMLFRPYQAIYIGKKQLPFTPGLIPRNQERLAKRVSDTIMGSLLTPKELQNLARRLLKPERVEGAIIWLLRLALDQIRLDKEQRTAKILAGILRDVLGESLPRLLKFLARRDDFLEAQINQIFDQILLDFQLSEEQATKLADWLIKVVLPPDSIRQILVDLLTDRTIAIIDEGFREKASGTYWVVANLFGLRNTLTRLRTFCLDEKEIANARIGELLQSLEVRDRLKKWLKNLSLQDLPVSTVRQLRKTIRDTIRSYLQTRGTDYIQGLSSSIDWENIASLLLNRLRNSATITASLGVISKELALILERYLERDLEVIVAQAIPILAIDQAIIDRVKSTSAAELEAAIEGIVKNELQAIVNLGGLLGFVVGLLQTVLLLLR